MITLYPWQQRSADSLTAMFQSHDSALDASFTGSGKTFVALQVMKNLGVTPLIVCPKSVIPSWERSAREIGCPVIDIINVEKLKTGKTPYLKKGKKKTDFIWLLPKGSYIIFDESHKYSGYKSQNAFILALTKAYGLKTLLLSATAADSPLKMRAIGYLLGMHRFRNHYSWCLDNGCYTNVWGGIEFLRGPGRLPHLKRIHDQIFPERGVRLRIADVPDFPETSIQAEAYDLEGYTDIVNQIYDEMELELKEPGSNALTVMLRARQRAELFKVPLLTDMIVDALDEGNRPVIFVSFRDTIESLKKSLADAGITSVSEIIGGQKDREQQRVAFQSGLTEVCLCMIQAGGVGIDLDDQVGDAPRISLITPDYSAEHLKQALGRIHRQSTKSKSVQKILFAAGTIEEDACRAVNRKLQNLDMLNDGDLQEGIAGI